MLAYNLRIAGRVQGVGFRAGLRDEAERLGVSGWARNRRDGSVEASVQGPDAAVHALLAWARHGPPAARVDTLRATPVTERDAPRYPGFELLPTA